MTSSSHLIGEALESHPVGDTLIERASMHVSAKLRSYLFSSSPLARGNAMGELYEALVYESILDIAASYNVISRVVRKRADVPLSQRTQTVTLDQDGLMYDKRGDLIIRGGGTDLGEFDVVLFDKLGDLLFCEAVISGNYLEGFDREIQYKRHLLTELLGCKSPFLLISAKDIRNKEVVKRILSETGSEFALFDFPNLNSMDKIASRIGRSSEGTTGRNGASSKLCYWNELRTVRKLDYQRNHHQMRGMILSSIANGVSKDSIKEAVSSSLVQRVILGTLTEQATENLLASKEFMIEGRRLTISDFTNRFSKIAVTLSLPRLRPIFYLREKRNQAFLKMAAETISSFEFEKKIGPDFSFAFYTLLDKEESKIEDQEIRRILDLTLTPDILGTKRKLGHHPNMTR